MQKVLWLVFKPLVIDIGFTMASKALLWGLNTADSWMLVKVRSTDTKFDDVLYESFHEHKQGIESGIEQVLKTLKGK